MRKLYQLFAIVSILLLSSCQRACTRFNKKIQTAERNYQITMYSGGKVVFQDRFRGIINDSEGSDGMYYYKGDTLVEVSRDYIIKSTN